LAARIGRARDALAAFAQRGMVRSIGVLVGGTVVAHAITMLAMPITTRLFTPEDFSALAVFASLLGILSVACCLRFDAAVVMPEDDRDGINLFAVAMLATVATTALVALVMLALPASAYDLLREPSLIPYLWMLTPGVFIMGAYLALQAWFVRQKRFRDIAQSRAGQATVAAGIQIGMGYAGIAPLGLLLGHVLNYGAGSLTLLGGMLARNRRLLAQVSWRHMVTMAKAYNRFPRYSVWEGLANGLSNSAPLIIIAAVARGPEAGHLTLALFVLQAPMALLGNAVAQVYLSEAPKAYREGRLDRYTADVLAGLAAAGSGPLLFAAIASPVLFGTVFGEPWVRSGVLVAWMAPWFFLQFLSSPICNALHVTGRQRAMMIFHLLGVVVRVGGVILAGAFATDMVSEVWAISGWVFYAAYLGTILAMVGVPGGTGRNTLRRAAPSIAAGLAGGLAVVFVPRILGL